MASAGKRTELVSLQRKREGSAPADHVGRFWVGVEQVGTDGAEVSYIVHTEWEKPLVALLGVASLGEFYRFIWPQPGDPPREPIELVINSVTVPIRKRELQFSCSAVVNQPE